MNAIINVTTAIANWFWGWPILIIMIGGGLYLTFRCGFVQIRRFGYICSQTFGKMFQKAEKGKISSFGAACAALGSTIGSSNIVGVPVAIALCGAINCLPSCASQILSVASQAKTFSFDENIFALVVIALVTVIVFGGIKRISSVMEKTVPFMAGIYLLGVLVILIMNYDNIIPSLIDIFRYAFTPHAAFGGFAGSTVMLAMRWGIARGVYSNEAGYGTAAIAHSASDVDHPVRQAIWGVFEVTLDTLMVCTATALAVLTTGVWTQEGIDSGALDQAAFGQSFGTFGEIFVAVCIFLFAVTTITVVVYYGEKNMQFVFRTRTAGLVWRCVIIAGMIFALFGLELTIAYQFVDFFGALKIIPNMLALVWLAPQIVKLNKEYWDTPGLYYMADMEARRAKKAAKKTA